VSAEDIAFMLWHYRKMTGLWRTIAVLRARKKETQ
jgi:hypothetical protein